MNFLSLTNRILKAFNEVQLTSTTFASAYGFYAEAQDAINRAIFDIYTEEDVNWPFAWTVTSFTTAIGQQPYTLSSSYLAIDWDSFYTPRPQLAISNITKVGTVITVTTSVPHQMIVGDAASLYNINDSLGTNLYYNATLGAGAVTGWTVASVTSGTIFTFGVPNAAPTPSLGFTPYVTPPYQAQNIDLIDWNTYKLAGLTNDINGKVPQAVPTSFNQPANVVRVQDNSIILTPIPDRIYTVTYGGFTPPVALVNYNDVPTIPSQFEQVIVDKALHYCYMFRDNDEQAEIADARYTKNVNKMRRILIPISEYMRFEG